MKKLLHYISVFAAACIVAACSSESYPGLEYEFDTSGNSNTEEGKVVDLGTLLRVFVSEQGFYTASALTETKGTGPFVVPDTTAEDRNHYSKAIFRLFSFRDRPEQQGPFDYVPDYTRRSGDTSDANVNCLIDGTQYEHGMPAHLRSDHTGEFQMLRPNLVNDTTLYYSHRFDNIGYRFFAYHLDDAKINNAQREGSHIYYDIDIDGTQDIMMGQSQKLTPEVLDRRHSTVNLTPGQRDKVLNIGNYSSYSSSLGIYPIVDMKHMLARLQFRAYPADESCHLVYIDSISIYSKYSGRIIVAARDSSEMGITFNEAQRKWFKLKRRDTSRTNKDSIGAYPLVDLAGNNLIEWDPATMSNADWTKNKYTCLGTDMLVPADSTYKMVLYYHQKVAKNETSPPETHRFVSDFTLPAPHIDANYDEASGRWVYKPGKIYYVRIAVYGMQQPKFEVDLDPWGDGGGLEVDPEEQYYP